MTLNVLSFPDIKREDLQFVSLSWRELSTQILIQAESELCQLVSAFTHFMVEMLKVSG